MTQLYSRIMALTDVRVAKNFDDRVVLFVVQNHWQMRLIVSLSAFDDRFLSALTNIRQQHTVALIQRCDI